MEKHVSRYPPSEPFSNNSLHNYYLEDYNVMDTYQNIAFMKGLFDKGSEGGIRIQPGAFFCLLNGF